MLIGCVNVYEDGGPLLERSLASVRERVDRLVVVDGRYRAFAGAAPWSLDSTLEQACLVADEVVVPSEPWPDEQTKRNRYLTGSDGDWYLVIDADEEVEGSVPSLGNAPHGYTVRIEMACNRTLSHPIYRLFPHLEGLRYEGTHHCVMVGDEIENGLAEPQDSLRIVHHRSARDPERELRKRAYCRWHSWREAPFRREHARELTA